MIPSQEYFADGMTEALIANLAHIRAVRVVSRTSVMRFKGAARSLPEIARALEVDAVVEGSVQRSGARVRINVQLVHAPTDTHLWARQYERELTDVLKLQADVARAVVEEIQVQITAEERARLASADAVNVGAYQEYLLGQHYLWRLNEEDLTRAISHFDEAIRLDPAYAAAHAGLSHAWWWRGVWGGKTLKQVEPPSRAAARTALQLDDELAEAHVSMGRIAFGYDWDWSAARNHFRRALDIDPNNRDAHFFHGMLFMALGRFDEAIAHMERAERLDPLSAAVQSGFGRVLYRARRFDDAIVHLNEAIELEPQTPGNYHRLADVYEEVGQVRRGARSPWQGGRVAGATGWCEPGHCPDLRADGEADGGEADSPGPAREQVGVDGIGDGLRRPWRQGRRLSIAVQDVRGTRGPQLRQDRSPLRQPARGSSMAGPAAPHEFSVGRGQDRVHGRSRRPTDGLEVTATPPV